MESIEKIFSFRDSLLSVAALEKFAKQYQVYLHKYSPLEYRLVLYKKQNNIPLEAYIVDTKKNQLFIYADGKILIDGAFDDELLRYVRGIIKHFAYTYNK